ncbi:uncharacterized protein F5Z01DRAFT_683017 [Emericellopsis atlantica]|uniref:Uncharacterized protein n=1 Tax=Emericellopsis atlantica TaxID=2614577 RepID=A0A9P7ZHW9_9HYPO|nr:uncharacterized protein F5Z01DRAFT_683017 [Emericellopsis atlantica]KAG9251987.1 hypothetical protein F5Z01DRAFT_683017 [Emericellopsis atlantica]
MRFLDVETENTTLSDVLTAPIFTQAVQRHVLAEHDRTGRSDKSKPFAQYGLLAGDASGKASDPRLFFNVAAPSSTFICGSQGSGKSHSLSCLLENCLLQNEALFFHYDTFVSDSGGSLCEAAFLSSHRGVDVRVLCAPTNVTHIKRIYAKLPNVTIEVLRINQEHLNTKRMLDLMAVSSVQGTLPLYLHVVIRILRDLRVAQQQKGSGFNYAKFKRDLDEQSLTEAQLAPLKQRLDTLESFMVSDQARAYEMALGLHASRNHNSKTVVDPQHGNSWAPKAGQLSMVDLSCPCVTAEIACSLFGICLSLFLEQDTQVGRVVALDEAHKYMTDSSECQALTENLLSTIRLQRHIATRVIISTQEPTISPGLLDLCSVTIVHRFTSPDWMRALQKHLAGASSWLDPNVDDEEGMKKGSRTETGIRPLALKKDDVAGDLFSQVVRLRTGEALLFAPSAVIDMQTADDGTAAADSGEDSTYDSGVNAKEGGGTLTTPVFAFGRSYGAPKEEAPKEEAPKEEAPKEEAPKEEAPREEAPKEEAPKEEAPKEEAPSENRVVHLGNGVLKIRIRKRVTTDGGRSIMAG